MRLRLDVDHVGREKHQCFSLYLRLANAPAMVSSMPLNAMPRAAIQFTPVCGSASCTAGRTASDGRTGVSGAASSGVASCTGGSSGVSGVTTSSGVSTSSSWGGVGSSGSAGVVTVKFFRATVVKL